MLCFLRLFGGAITTIMWKLIFDFLTEPLGLPIEWYWEYAILAVVGFIAYIIAYRCVGKLYYSGVINGRGIGSFLHWLIRLIFFAVIWAITYGVIVIGRIIISHWIIVVSTLMALSVLGILLYVVLKRKNHLKQARHKQEDKDM